MNWFHSAAAVIAVFSCCCHGQDETLPAYDARPDPLIEKQAILTSTSSQADTFALDFNKMNDHRPQNSVDLLRQFLLSPYQNSLNPEQEFSKLQAPDRFVFNDFLRRRRRGQHHNNIQLSQRRKKALSVLSRCCPFWRSSSTSTSTQSASSIPGAGVSSLVGRREQGGGGGMSLQDFENESEFLRASLYGGGHSFRPYNMRLRWGK